MNTTLWYKSKTLWVNLIAITALAIQAINASYVISPEIQGSILAIINLILRAVTSQPLDWGTPAKPVDGGTAGFVQIPLLFMILSLFALGACATTAPVIPPATTAPGAAATVKDNTLAMAGKSLLAVKSTIVTAATATDAFCKAGKIGPDKCAQAKAAYELAKPAYDSAVDAYLLMTQGYGDAAAFGSALGRVQAIADNLLTLSGVEVPGGVK